MTENVSEKITLLSIVRTMQNWFLYLRQKLFFILLFMLFGGVIGFLYAKSKKLQYSASLSFALEDDRSGGLGGALSLASEFGLDLGSTTGGVFSGANLLSFMKSRTMIERALLAPVTIKGKQISLIELYLDFSGVHNSWANDKNLTPVYFSPLSRSEQLNFKQDSLLNDVYGTILKDNVNIDQKEKKTSIISIDVKSENELFSKLFAEALARETADYYTEFKTKKSANNVIVLQKQSDSVRRELNMAIIGVAASNDNTFNLNPAFGVNKTPASKRQVDIQTNSAVLTELMKNLELAKISLLKETPLIQIIDKPILPLNKTRPSTLIWSIIGVFIGFVIISFSLLGIKFGILDNLDLQKEKV